MESVIQFSNRRGEILRGVYHTPESCKNSAKKHLLIFPNGGVMGGEGDFRAYVMMSRLFVNNGYHVLRFSPAGLGYSEGHIQNCSQKNLYNQIENGLLVDDIKASVEFAKNLDNFSSITLSGVCGGAITTFLAAAELDEVEYVIPIGIPVILDDEGYDYSQRTMALDKQYVIKMYLGNLVSIRSWLRLFSGRSDITTIKSLIMAFFTPKTSYLNEGDAKSKFSDNPLFFKAARKIFKKRKKVLFVFGDTDGFWWEFQNLFLNKHYKGVKETPFDLYLSHRSNHMLVIPEMQFDVATAMLSWMEKYHGKVLQTF